MPSLARMLGLMLVFAGPLGLAAQTFPPRASSVRPGAMPTTPPSGWPHPSNRSLPAAGPMQSGQVVPASYQSPAGSFSEEPGYAHDAPSVGGLTPENRSPETSEVEPPMRWDMDTPVSIRQGPNAGYAPANMPADDVSGRSMSLSGSAAPVSLSPPGKLPKVPLSPPGRSDRNGADGPGGVTSLVTAIGSLGLVLGVFFLIAWGMRRARPAGMTALPGEVFEVLGRAPMANRQQVHLLRCGNKLLLVCVTPTGTETLTEIVDPMEVDRLAGLCRQSQPGSATEAFRQVFKQFAPQNPDSGRLSRLFAGGDREDRPSDGPGTRMAPSELEDQNV